MNSSLDPVDVHVGARVRSRRIMLGMSREQLAAALDATAAEVEEWEAGRSRIGSRRLLQLGRILRVPSAFFFVDAHPPEWSGPSSLGPAAGLQMVLLRVALAALRALYGIVGFLTGDRDGRR